MHTCGKTGGGDIGWGVPQGEISYNSGDFYLAELLVRSSGRHVAHKLVIPRYLSRKEFVDLILLLCPILTTPLWLLSSSFFPSKEKLFCACLQKLAEPNPLLGIRSPERSTCQHSALARRDKAKESLTLFRNPQSLKYILWELTLCSFEALVFREETGPLRTTESGKGKRLPFRVMV